MSNEPQKYTSEARGAIHQYLQLNFALRSHFVRVFTVFDTKTYFVHSDNRSKPYINQLLSSHLAFSIIICGGINAICG